MKFYIFLGFVAACSAHHLFPRSSYDGSFHRMNVTEIIRSNGYPVQTHTVQTSDGYILELIRIPTGNRRSQGSQYQGQQQSQYQNYNRQSQEQVSQEQYSQEKQSQYQSGHSQKQHQQQWQSQKQGYGYKNQQRQSQEESASSSSESMEAQNRKNAKNQQGQSQYQGYGYKNQQGQSQEESSSSSSESVEAQNRKNAKNQQGQSQYQGYLSKNQQGQSQEEYLLSSSESAQAQNRKNAKNQQGQSQYQGYLSANQQGQSQEESSSSSELAQAQNRKNVKNYQPAESDSSSSSSEETGNMKRPVVLLMPSLLSSADDFVLGGPSEGLAFILADNGYDVFIGNARGSVYGRQHTVLNPDRDPAFWRFCWDDIGMKDLPAIIDKMLKITRQNRIYYIGHMQGSTVFYVMASERPEYNNKIRAMVSLGPVAFMGHSTNPMLKLVSQNLDSHGWLIKNLGVGEFKPSTELLTQGGQGECSRMGNNEQMCRNEFFLLNGFNSKNLNSTTVASMLQRVPAGASARQIIHYAQLVKSGRFQKFSSNSHAEDYSLDKVTSPIILMHTPDDSVSSMTDVEMLKRKLPNVKQSVSLNMLTNNLDLLHAKDVADVVYSKMMKMMKNMGRNAETV